MLRIAENLKVLDSVVVLISVDVMDMLIGREFPA
jgi:hypothetical protein